MGLKLKWGKGNEKMSEIWENWDIVMSKIIDRWLEPNFDYKVETKCPNLTRVDLEGYSIKIRSKWVERWF